MEDNKKNYDDIIGLEHHVSKNRKRMSLYDRAAQFSPFAALVGYEAAVEETARLTENKIELTEERKLEISKKLQLISENLNKEFFAQITYFLPDSKKEGGAYVSVRGQIKLVDTYERKVVMRDRREIPIDQLWEIEIL